MTMYVLIQHTSPSSVTASLVGWPNLSASGKNEAEAVQLLRQSFAEKLGDARIVPFEVGVAQPWLQTAGVFQHDPFREELDELIANDRRELDRKDETEVPQDRAA